MPRPTRWTESELRDAVSMSRTLGEVARRLDLSVGGGTYASLRRHIARLGLDAGHIAAPVSGRPAPRRSWTDDDLAQVVATSMTMAEVHRRLGYRPSGGTHRLLIAHIRRLGLDTAHFRGQA